MPAFDRIAIHHSASPRATTVDRIRGWHTGYPRNWSDIGYHRIVRLGKVHRGRGLERMGAHVKGHNWHAIGICITGNYEEENTHDEDLMAAADLCKDLMDRFGIPEYAVWGHGEFKNTPATACPGKYFNMPDFRLMVKEDAIPDKEEPDAPDVSEWAKEAMEWGIAEGITDGTHPEREVTREQHITMLHRLFKKIKEGG